MQTTSQSQATARKRSYLDPIHKDIVLDRHDPAERLIMDLIDTSEFQRLRRVHQLGVSFFTFQGAEGSRFTHCVGVMHIASKLMDLLCEQNESVAQYRPLVLASGLLHDIGHGPYSHVTEKILGYDHEDWSCRIITGDTEVNRVLRAFHADMPDQITSVLKKTFKPEWVSHLISSQLDCDRMDYLLRDSYQTGTAYGLFALQRILTSLAIDDASDRIVVVGEKGQMAVEDYLFSRYSMYSQVYYHRKNLAARAQLSKILKRAKELGSKLSFIDEQTRKFLHGETLSVKDYLYLDDIQMTYHMKRWAEDADPIVADLSKRFLNRQLFNALRLHNGNADYLRAVESKTAKIVERVGFDPKFYVCIERTGLRPYDYYRPEEDHPQTNIMVRLDNGQTKELSSVSNTVEALVRCSFDTLWLIYPPEVRNSVLEEIQV